MPQVIDHLRIIRSNILTATQDLSESQLTTVPPNFNNHILWNMGHVLATQQILIYKLSGNDMYLTPDFVERYRKGSYPGDTYPYHDDLSDIREQLVSTVDKLDADLSAGIFSNYEEYQTSFGVKLTTADEAVVFNNLHESLHLGYITAMKHLV